MLPLFLKFLLSWLTPAFPEDQTPFPPQENLLNTLVVRGALGSFFNPYHHWTPMVNILICLPGLLKFIVVSIMSPGPSRESVNIC